MRWRGERGRFLAGNPGGPGRPRRDTERRYMQALVDAVPLEEWAAIVTRAVADARGGDAQARAWLGKHLCGDDPLALAELVDELRAELERLKNAPHDAGAAGPAAAGGVPQPGPGGPDAGGDPA